MEDRLKHEMSQDNKLHRLLLKRGRVTKVAGKWTPVAHPALLRINLPVKFYAMFYRGEHEQSEIFELVNPSPEVILL